MFEKVLNDLNCLNELDKNEYMLDYLDTLTYDEQLNLIEMLFEKDVITEKGKKYFLERIN